MTTQTYSQSHVSLSREMAEFLFSKYFRGAANPNHNILGKTSKTLEKHNLLFYLTACFPFLKRLPTLT